jgi:hypothetical protein
MLRNSIRIAAVGLLILLPFVVRWLYLGITAYPDEIILGTGRPHGRYHQLCEALKVRIERELPVTVKLVPTNGSLDNLCRLRRREVDFAFYQPGTLEAFRRHDPDSLRKSGMPPWHYPPIRSTIFPNWGEVCISSTA